MARGGKEAEMEELIEEVNRRFSVMRDIVDLEQQKKSHDLNIVKMLVDKKLYDLFIPNWRKLHKMSVEGHRR